MVARKERAGHPEVQGYMIRTLTEWRYHKQPVDKSIEVVPCFAHHGKARVLPALHYHQNLQSVPP